MPGYRKWVQKIRVYPSAPNPRFCWGFGCEVYDDFTLGTVEQIVLLSTGASLRGQQIILLSTGASLRGQNNGNKSNRVEGFQGSTDVLGIQEPSLDENLILKGWGPWEAF